MHTRFALPRGILGGLLVTLFAVGTVAAYAGEVAATVEASGPSGPQACGTPITITTRVEDVTGKPIEGQPVTWSFVSGNVSGDTILDTTTTTNSSGIATTQVQLACAPHTVTIEATADLATGTLALTSSGEALPRTDTVPSSTYPAMALAALAVILGSGMILRRLAGNRR